MCVHIYVYIHIHIHFLSLSLAGYREKPSASTVFVTSTVATEQSTTAICYAGVWPSNLHWVPCYYPLINRVTVLTVDAMNYLHPGSPSRRLSPCCSNTVKVKSLSRVRLFAIPMDCSLPGSSVHGNFPGKSTGVGCHFLLQGIFPTQGLNPGLTPCGQTL